MGKLMKKYLLAFLVALVSVEVAYSAATKFTDLTVTGTLTSATHTNSGNATTTGNQTVTGNLAVTGTSALSNTLTETYGVAAGTMTATNSTMAVVVSSAATSGDKVCVGGAFAALPTTGFNRGCLVVLTSDMKLYISTETVVGTVSWKSVGSQ